MVKWQNGKCHMNNVHESACCDNGKFIPQGPDLPCGKPLSYHASSGPSCRGACEKEQSVDMTKGYVRKLTTAAMLLALTAGAGALAAPMPEKDQDRIVPQGGTVHGKDSESLLPYVPDGGRQGMDGAVGGPDEGAPVDIGPDVPPDFQYEEPAGAYSLEDLISEDIPDLRAVELTEDAAKRALDAFAEVYGKFDDAEIAKYPTLQEFAEKSPAGKKFAGIIRKHGFGSVREWNDIITNIGFAFTSIEEGHDDEIFRQIKQVEADSKLPKERREKLLKYLRALIPSVNNRKVLHALMKDPVYAKKLNLLEGGVEGE